jgi:hypothetical protein
MLSIFLFMIISFWMSSIIVEQKVFQEAREFIVNLYEKNKESLFLKKLCQLVMCVICVGFWSGLFITWTGFDVFKIDPFWDLFYGGLLGSFSSYVGLVITSIIDAVLQIKFGIEL